MQTAIKTIALVCILAAIPSRIEAKKTYVALIPNGDNTGVSAVGHEGGLGTADPNQFGKDFSKGGRSWTKAFCQMDSDGDGFTNGQGIYSNIERIETKIL